MSRSIVRCLALAFGFSLLLGFSPRVVRSAEDAQQVAKQIDTLLAEELFSALPTEQRASLADDETFLRRVSLDLTGHVPRREEVIAFSLDPDPDKRAKLVDKLLAEPRFGENWGNYWRDVIYYRRTEDRALVASSVTGSYLAEQFNQNTSWAEIAKPFITAEGDVLEDGRTGLIMAQAGLPEETVAEISRIFLGIQIQCAQCHDHPTDRWKREQFHELAAFFPRVAVRPDMSGERRTFLVTVTDSPFNFRANDNNRFRGTPEHYMPDLENPSERGELMQPVFFVTGENLQSGARDAERRGQLAEFLTAPTNPWFAKAYVNRMWSELVGEGFYEPVDDIGPDRECSAPKTLDALAVAFVDSGHDAKWLFRTITATEAYQRESQTRRTPDETPMLANCAQRLRGDQLYNALIAVLGIDERFTMNRGPRGPYGGFGGPRTVFNLTFGYDPSERRDEVAGSIPQALAMMNSPFINQSISAQRYSGLGKLLLDVKDNEAVTIELYLRAVSREPSDGELKTCLAYVAEVGDRNEAFEDILWSLINSTEFLHRR